HLFFAFGFGLLVCDRLAGLAVDRLKSDNVIAPEADYRTREQRLDSAPLTNLAPDLTGDSVIRRALHHLKRFSGALLGEDIKVGRLLQLDYQTLFKRAVKNRVARSVDEVGEEDRVFIGQRRRGAEDGTPEVP